FSVDMPFDGTVTHGIVIEASGITVGTGTCVRDCDMIGWADFSNQIDGVEIPSYNVMGRNVGSGLTAAPTTGFWAKGDEVALDQAAGSTAPRAKCVTAGLPGTWKTYGNLSA